MRSVSYKRSLLISNVLKLCWQRQSPMGWFTSLGSPPRLTSSPLSCRGAFLRTSSESSRFHDRTFDVGIAEQHAVTFAAGLACEGLRPFCVIYSTFLQRGYDQIIHDVALQDLPGVPHMLMHAQCFFN